MRSYSTCSIVGNVTCVLVLWFTLHDIVPSLQGAAPKKPYNPVLGEVFRCYWDIPGGRRTAPNADEQVR